MDYCWLWSGSYYASGYGQVWSPRLRRGTQAHRFVYEELVGQIPEGLQIDHICRVKGCVNPKHLRVVTCRENIMAPGSTCLAKKNTERDACVNGHAYTEASIYLHKGHRHCRICRRDFKRSVREQRRHL